MQLFTRSRLAALLVLGLAFASLISGCRWLEFADESDNFLGGYLIAHGQVLYRDYFSHHMPLPYYLAALPALLGVASAFGYRVFTALLILGMWTFVIVRFRNRVPLSVLSLFVLTIGIGYPWFLGHMFLAEMLVAYCLLIIAVYFLAIPISDWTHLDHLVIALAAYGALMCSLLAAYPLGVFLVYYLYSRVVHGPRVGALAFIRREAGCAIVLAAPFAATVAALFATGSLESFLQDALVFNQVYYSRYAVGGDPLHIAAALIRNDYQFIRFNLNPLAWQTVNGFTLVADAVAFACLLRARRFAFAIGFALVVAFARGRGDPFHDQAYYVLSFFTVAATIVAVGRFLPTALAHVRVNERWSPSRTVGATLGSLYLLLAVTFYVNMAMLRPVANASGQSTYASVIAAMTDPRDRVWIAPLDFGTYLRLQRLPASRYAFYLPWLADSPAINAQLLDDLRTSRPPVIIFPVGLPLERYEAGQRQIIDLDQYGQQLRLQLARDYVAVDDSDAFLNGVLIRRDQADELRQRLHAAQANGRVPQHTTSSIGRSKG